MVSRWMSLSKPTPRWQNPTISLEKFVNQAKLFSAFFNNGFTQISPDTSMIHCLDQFNVDLFYENSNGINIIISALYLVLGQNYRQLGTDVCSTNMELKKVRITCNVKEKGEYLLYLMVLPKNNYYNYEQIVSLKIKSGEKGSSNDNNKIPEGEKKVKLTNAFKKNGFTNISPETYLHIIFR